MSSTKASMCSDTCAWLPILAARACKDQPLLSGSYKKTWSASFLDSPKGNECLNNLWKSCGSRKPFGASLRKALCHSCSSFRLTILSYLITYIAIFGNPKTYIWCIFVAQIAVLMSTCCPWLPYLCPHVSRYTSATYLCW